MSLFKDTIYKNIPYNTSINADINVNNNMPTTIQDIEKLNKVQNELKNNIISMFSMDIKPFETMCIVCISESIEYADALNCRIWLKFGHYNKEIYRDFTIYLDTIKDNYDIVKKIKENLSILLADTLILEMEHKICGVSLDKLKMGRRINNNVQAQR